MFLSEVGTDHEHSALGLAEGCAPWGARGYISGVVFFMYPYVFVAGPNKHDACSLSHVPTEREIRQFLDILTLTIDYSFELQDLTRFDYCSLLSFLLFGG